MTELQTRIQSLLDQFVADGTERGAQVAIYKDGQLVVDTCAGIANVHTGEKVTTQTLFPVFSTTKGMTATIIHRLAQRGLLDYDTPISALWPEFAAHSKETITIRHALNHTSGLPHMPLGMSREELSDWATICQKIAELMPISAPGERTEYHAITFGYILGEVASRASGRTFPQLWHDELCAPLGVENEMFCGLSANHKGTVAWLEEPNAPRPEPPSQPTGEAIPFWVWPLSDWMNTPEAQQSVSPASTGIMTARAIARHYAALVPGGVDGIELLPPARIQTALAPQPPTHNPEEAPFALGYARIGTAFGHGGYGGSLGMADPENNWAFGFTHNLFTEQQSVQAILHEVEKLSASPELT